MFSNNTSIPDSHQGFQRWWYEHSKDAIHQYVTHQCSFVPNLLPEIAIQLSATQTLQILENRLGGHHRLYQLLDYTHQEPSPVASQPNGQWLRYTNMVGVNVRTIGNFWNVIKYLLTVPDVQSSVHLLPIWEPGVVASLYGMSSWNINQEFFSPELAVAIPQLNTVEKQLKAVTNIIHSMGRTVGMDVIPHTDRYSEIVLANPSHFEWLQRDDTRIINHRANLHEAAEALIFDFLATYGPAVQGETLPLSATNFFSDSFSETQRLLILFGTPNNYQGRQARREQLVQWLYERQLETVPATMGPPYRGLAVNNDDDAKTIDEKGRVWRDYSITKPEKFSRAFGPLTRYKLYDALDDNRQWGIDFKHARQATWDYACEHYAAVQAAYGFDFMRGDMAHVQMRPEGVPAKADHHYDILKTIKNHIQQNAPYFGSFAETFLAPPNEMAYGDECDHLERSDADTTLGDLQSVAIHEPAFLRRFAWYRELLTTRNFAPNFTIMTADKDDPRFDEFYLYGNEARLFMGLLMGDMPSYMGLGFEQRDMHPIAAPNEHYTKLYVFHLSEGPKATRGPYTWGKNGQLFQRLTRIRHLAAHLMPYIGQQSIRWILAPDPSGERQVIAWTQVEKPSCIMVVNVGRKPASVRMEAPADYKLEFVTIQTQQLPQCRYDDGHFYIDNIVGGECLVFG